MHHVRAARLAVAFVGLVAGTQLSAQHSQSWTLCTEITGGGACGRVNLRTAPTVGGTNIKVTVQNLQGQGYGDNTFWNAVVQLRFWDMVSPVVGGITGGFVNGVLENGATGQIPNYSLLAVNQFGGSVINLQNVNWPTTFGILGVASGPYAATYGGGTVTNSGNEQVSFSIFSTQAWDAFKIQSLSYTAVGSVFNGFDTNGLSCNTNPNPNFPVTFSPFCKLIDNSRIDEAALVPEPASSILIGIGLAGVGIFARRRRTR